MVSVVAVNGSPRMEKGRTTKILAPFLDGMKKAGASVELFYANRLDIKPCTGELHCWNEDPGFCYINDDMQSLYPRLRKADIVVLATPVYVPLPGEMQNLINRLVPLMDPSLKNRNNRTRARLRSGTKISKLVLVSTSGWWELGNFRTVLRIAKEFAEDCSIKFIGALLRPHSSYLTEDNPKTKEVLKAAKQAGYQLVKEGKISKDLLSTISQPLTSKPKWWNKH